jgi:hypothetical protein
VTVTFVIHLVAEELARGEIVGTGEHVETGTRHVLRSSSDLVAMAHTGTAATPVERRDGPPSAGT